MSDMEKHNTAMAESRTVSSIRPEARSSRIMSSPRVGAGRVYEQKAPGTRSQGA